SRPTRWSAGSTRNHSNICRISPGSLPPSAAERSPSGPCGVWVSSAPSLCGCLRAPKQTETPSPPCSPRPSQRTSTTTPSPSSAPGERETAPPGSPHWSLPCFAVDIALQGKRLGSQLMEPCLQIVDASPLPAYLETPNPRTISFYERHGFEVTGDAQAGTCPPVTFMLRAAR